jgi:hypothetical protein
MLVGFAGLGLSVGAIGGIVLEGMSLLAILVFSLGIVLISITYWRMANHV